MREDFLHFIWRWKRFDMNGLQTTTGEAIEILHSGELNTDAGPDFFNAKIRIGETLWAGNVEIHLKSSDWLLHQHQENGAYQNVILHVVMQEDQKIFRQPDGAPIPTLVLQDRIPLSLYDKYQQLTFEKAQIPCHAFYLDIPEIIRLNWLDRLLVERLEQKTEQIALLLNTTDQSWEEAFYIALARNFGLKINAMPFELLAKSLSLHILSKYKNNLFQIEALLFGQAGLLDATLTDEYAQKLRKEYLFLAQKHQLTPINPDLWKFLRLRPVNFPSVRLAQFSQLIFQSVHLFSKILEAKNVRELEHLFDAGVSEYWETHYIFDKKSPKRSKNTGKDFIQLLLINTIVPFLFYYGKNKNLPDYQDKAMAFLENLPAESNSILDFWANIGAKPRNAYHTQAFLTLTNQYCKEKRCLECAMGNSILR
jgi:Protein of unknown function (DUF2851)